MFNNYRAAKMAFDLAPGSMVLRCIIPVQKYRVCNINELIVEVERKKWEGK
jgi:hypothetical protein